MAKARMRVVLRVTKNKQVRKVRMSTLKKGDMFILLNGRGQLDVVAPDGKFIFKAKGEPKKMEAPMYCGVEADAVA